ncbi:hypothetical protein OHU11_42130 (plasmid) [Streptomyces sp. NBC_00257]|uniref:hypothetical protein n=1 Tax=unclassified Streptomyces TaxID=2593676 RepID=UPI002255DDE0|nr:MULTISPECIES: hypothetical protein [unclassified Streptomyces]MCX5434780.1 hypothetical protein [Streptomyces sp. NBC_00062]
MNASSSVPKVAAPVTYRCDDYVLYRDPEKFWTGKPGHTTVCRVDATIPFASGEIRYTLARLDNTGGLVKLARSPYMRLLPPADAMHDIDTAPLNITTGAADMAPAAVAWLTAQTATASRRPELPRA